MSPLLPYWLRLACLSLGVGAVSYLAGCLAAAGLAPLVLRSARCQQDQHPAQTARRLLRLRLLPLALSGMVVGGLCLPSYIWLEPMDRGERWGLGFCFAAVAGALLLVAATGRLARALHQHRRLQRQARRLGRVLVVPGPQPLMALCGILRPRLLVSRNLLQQLSPAQLKAGQRHERAHLRARDNLKRLLIVATPAPGRRLRELERAWARAAEWAADDQAVAGDAHCSVALASTLVAVARLRPAVATCAAFSLHSPFAGEGEDLAARVGRLLGPARPMDAVARAWPGWVGTLALIWMMLQPTTLVAAHHILEHLVR